MCGIVGYIGKSTATPILLDGLRRLEYRGYDSAGITTVDGGRFQSRKRAGRIQALADLLKDQPAPGTVGISHTRWATHGRPTDENAHPHFDQSGRLALVHNGVIENYQVLRAALVEAGHTFQSQTDTEILAHLIGKLYDEAGGAHNKARLLEAVRGGLKQVIGTYGIAALHLDVPDVIIGARRGSPLAVGLGKGENFLCSDPQAIIAHTQEAIYLKDYDVAVLERDQFEISTLEGGITGSYEVTKVDFTSDDVKLGEYPHYMLKEIFEQPNCVRDALRGRLSTDDASARLGGLNMTPQELREIDRVIVTGCGTAYNAGLVGEYLIESLAHLPCEVDFASEFRYRNMPMDKGTLVLAVSQSGETIDTLAAIRESLRKGPPHAEHLQQRRQHHRARMRRGRVHARRAGDRRGGDEVVHLATGGVHPACADPRTHQEPFQRRRAQDHQGARSPARPDRARAGIERPHPGRGRQVRGCQGHVVPGQAVQLPDRARGGAQDEGNHLHPERRATRARNSNTGSSRWWSRTCRASSLHPTTRCSTATSTASSRSRRGAVR